MQEEICGKQIDINSTIIMKGIAITFVVLGHLEIIEKAGLIGVSIFLCLSGYGLACSYERHRLDNYWIKRIRGVFIPYFVCNIFISLFSFVFNYKNFREFTITDIFCAVLGINIKSPLDPTMWYIHYIFIMYIMFIISK